MQKEIRHQPRWISPLLLTAALLAAAAALAALLFGAGGGHDHGRGTVANVTVNLGGKPVQEHCMTCHPLGGRPGTDSPHSEIAPHFIGVLGCTGCHLGEGMALDERISHGLPGHGARQILAGKDLQGSCYRCHHLAPLPGAEKAWRGYELFVENACDTCHTLSAATTGGHYGPGLNDVGSYLGLKALVEAIREPKREPVNSIMPRFSLSASQARSLAWFLKSRVKDPFYATPMEVRAGRIELPAVDLPIPETLPSAGALLAARRCLACHRFGEEDGRIAPDLTSIGAMRDARYLKSFMANPAREIPGAIMPRVPMTAEEQDRLLTFLSRQAIGPVKMEHGDTGRFDFEAPPAPAGGGAAKHLYMALCQRCHAAAGDGFGLIQPNLANFPRPFAGNASFFRRLPDERLLRSIGKGVPGTSMPSYGQLLQPEEIDSLLNLVFTAFVGTPRSLKEPLPPLPPRPATTLAPGLADARFDSLCVRCHGWGGTGKGPEHLRHLPRPRNLTNRPYFASLEDERIVRAIADGVPGTAMPSFRSRLAPEEIWGLAEKVRRLSGENDEHTTEPWAPPVVP